ncbi:M23 family metallopeptidase [Modestobacter sp. NPDC049651]|uniref:M23 family metallopeptidase n=1 Tax=unclassified Modestobacter TaxID=2643866 RepID=UPI0033C5BB84
MPRQPLRTSRAAVLAGLVAAVLAVGSTAPALADPVNPTDGQLADAAGAKDQAAAEVGRLQGLVAVAQSELEKAAVQAEAAGAAYDAAEEARRQADAAAERAAEELQAAQAAVAAAQGRIADFSHDTYKNGGSLTSEMALLDVAGPGELIQKAAMLRYVADHQLDVLGTLQTAQVQQARAETAARDAQRAKAAAEEQAEQAKATADQEVAAHQAAVQQASAQKAQLDQQLQAAEVRLLELQGARNAYEQWVAQKKAAEEAARRAQAEAEARAAADAAAAVKAGGSGYVRPASGTTSSCYGARWGVTHLGVDIAARIGTPVYAATSGVVQRAGAATGFGLAVYVRGDDGAVTVYGHVNRYFVQAGERVKAGEQIAEVGNRGQSTGPHLHFEVHPGGGMYSGAVDPVPWLRARGIPITGC